MVSVPFLPKVQCPLSACVLVQIALWTKKPVVPHKYRSIPPVVRRVLLYLCKRMLAVSSVRWPSKHRNRLSEEKWLEPVGGKSLPRVGHPQLPSLLKVKGVGGVVGVVCLFFCTFFFPSFFLGFTRTSLLFGFSVYRVSQVSYQKDRCQPVCHKQKKHIMNLFGGNRELGRSPHKTEE